MVFYLTLRLFRWLYGFGWPMEDREKAAFVAGLSGFEFIAVIFVSIVYFLYWLGERKK